MSDESAAPATSSAAVTQNSVDRSARIGWGRAVLATVAIAVAAMILLVYVPNAVLTRVHGFGRSGRVTIATAVFSFDFIAISILLRRLQRRGAI